MRPRVLTSACGFSLIEALVAALLVAAAVVGLAHLVAMGAEQALNSRRATSALTVAQGKLEQLRRAAWTFAPDGSRVSSTLLTASPPRSLEEDVSGYIDRLDAFGETVPSDGNAVSEYVRRWAISALSPDDLDTLTLHVCVFTTPGGARPDETPAVCVSGIRTRKP